MCTPQAGNSSNSHIFLPPTLGAFCTIRGQRMRCDHFWYAEYSRDGKLSRQLAEAPARDVCACTRPVENVSRQGAVVYFRRRPVRLRGRLFRNTIARLLRSFFPTVDGSIVHFQYIQVCAAISLYPTPTYGRLFQCFPGKYWDEMLTSAIPFRPRPPLLLRLRICIRFRVRIRGQ